jgi:LuxR family transcriptional regulator, maltose regulon positive regulatory protein
MKTPLLETKFYRPQVGPGFVTRSHLVTMLQSALDRKLTVISAPAGFGKTTLVAEWMEQLQKRHSSVLIAWLTLDESDRDGVRFLTYLISVLERIGILDASETGNLLNVPQPPPCADVLIGVINDIGVVGQEIVLVLDDYHLVSSSPVDDCLHFLLDHLPPRMHLVIASREDPLLPLARLRAQGQLAELRAADLRFSPPETAIFLNQMMRLNLSAEDIAALEDRTEGWIAGLKLAAISLQGQENPTAMIDAFSGRHQYVLDYLMGEVLDHQPKMLREFLLKTSILKRLTGPLCEALIDAEKSMEGKNQPSPLSPESAAHEDKHATGQETLEALDQANLFIVPLDNERRWYRYQHLFADLLLHRLHQEFPDEILLLHRKASDWYLEQELMDDAVEHALLAKEYQRAAELIEKHAESFWKRGEQVKLGRWLSALPESIVLSSKQLTILHAWHLFSTGQQYAAEDRLVKLEDVMGASSLKDGFLESQEEGLLAGRTATIRAFLASHRGDFAGIAAHSRKALEFLPLTEYSWRSTALSVLADALSAAGELGAVQKMRVEALKNAKASGNAYIALMAGIRLAVTHRQLGELARVVEICEREFEIASEFGLDQTALAGWLLAIWGETLAEGNQLAEGLERAQAGVALTERGSYVAMLGWSTICLVRILFSANDLTGAMDLVKKVETRAHKLTIPGWFMNMLSAWKARIWLAEGNLNAALQWAEECGLELDEAPNLLTEKKFLAFSRILSATGKWDEAQAVQEKVLQSARRTGDAGALIESLAVHAMTARMAGKQDSAVLFLEEALSLGEAGGFSQIFLDEGLPMFKLLSESASPEPPSEYIERLLAQFKDRSEFSVAKTDLVEPLSGRELEVLQLIAGGHSNPEIARLLFVSLNTIKAHTRSIYGKLDVHNRTQAVIRMQELGLQSSG